MNAPAGKIDIEHIIGEVAKRHRIALRPDDPAFAIVTINELVLKNTIQEAMKAMAVTLDRFDTSIQKAESRAGQILGQQIRESARQLRQAVRAEIVEGVKRTGRVELRICTGVGLFCLTLLCAVSFWLGHVLALR
jgi:Transcriptional activator TraM